MKIDFIKFQIGMQYENWEFDLEPIDLDIKKDYDKYRYFKNDITEVFGVEVVDIFLYFNLDVLFKIEVFLMLSLEQNNFIQIAEELKNTYGESKNRNLKHNIKEEYWESKKSKLQLKLRGSQRVLLLVLCQLEEK